MGGPKSINLERFYCTKFIDDIKILKCSIYLYGYIRIDLTKRLDYVFNINKSLHSRINTIGSTYVSRRRKKKNSGFWILCVSKLKTNKHTLPIATTKSREV
jgi:hypothetical protein